jgi:cell division protein FtsB
MTSLLRRLLLTAMPFGLMACVVSLAIFGDHGLIRRHHLRVQQADVLVKIDMMEAANAELRRKLRVLDSRRVGVERLVAQELMQVPVNTTIYRFEAGD